MRPTIIAANWKSNTSKAEGQHLIEQILQGSWPSSCHVIVAPPFVYLPIIQEVIQDSAIMLSAQDCSEYDNGAYTGQVSAKMLSDSKVEYVILGHSERRALFNESDETLKAKISLARAQGLKVIFCFGEQLEERKMGSHFVIVSEQLALLAELDDLDAEDFVLAYEPVWAIGTGETASPEQAEEMHAHIREELSSIVSPKFSEQAFILYGGSVKPNNAQSLFDMPNIDGALVGGASLQADDFLKIINAG